MKTHKIGLATCSDVPQLYDDDLSTFSAFKEAGLEPEAFIWNSNNNWRKYSAIIIRSTWDYWTQHSQFIDWILEIENSPVSLFNPASVLRDNSCKTYLKKIEEKNIPTIPTLWIDKGSNISLYDTISNTKWEDVVLKPSISGGAYKTFRLNKGLATQHQKQFEEILSNSEAMIQPLCPTILSHGEISFIFFNGSFSHAAIKNGINGDFRIQRTFGGSVAPYSASDSEILQAEAALKSYCQPEDLLYCRVDMVRSPNKAQQLLLMELEAIEPNLFFLSDKFSPHSAKRFVNALKKKLFT